jgi:hypothetical protein
MFADLDETIRQLLVQRGNLDSGEVDIAFEMPTREWAAGIARPTVNLYLYDLRENKDRRDPNPRQVRRGTNNTATISRPPVRLDLTYMVTAWASSIEDEHHVLSRVVLTLMQHPILPEEFLQGTLAGQEIATFTAQPERAIQSPADFWGSLDNDIKPSFDYRAVLTMDLGQQVTKKLALTSRIRVGPLGNGAAKEELTPRIGGRLQKRDDPAMGIAGARLTLVERALDTVTDEEGRYIFSGVPEGKYTLVITAPGSEERREHLEVPSANYDIEL